MQNLSVNDLLGVAATPDPSCSHGGSSNGKLSMGIVNSQDNGKRVTFSKALADALALEDKVEVALVPSKGCVLVSKKLASSKAIKGKLSARNEKRKICYNAGMVEGITKAFGLNFDEHVSVSYDDITLGNLDDGTPVAIVNVYNKYPVTTASTVTPDAN